VILIGEIRDAETANIAIQSALTGHLVLSSIHANDAVGVVLRLIDLGVEPFLVSSALIGVVAQRMVRRLCSHCARPTEGTSEERLIFQQQAGEERKDFLHGAGCKVCASSGYRGRTGIFEILCTSDHIKTMLVKSASAGEIRNQAIKEGMATLLQDGMLKVKKNITTPSEVIRNAYTVE
jgi:general secretion pathway protein E